LDSEHLRLSEQDSKDTPDSHPLDTTLKSPDEAVIKAVDPQFEPWHFKRSRGSDIPLVATDWDAKRFYSREDQLVEISSAEMRGIFEEDQKPRQDPAKISPE
jgi:hypothetical protein